MEPTTRRRARLTSVMTRRTFCLSSSLMGVSRGRPVWEAGTNTRTPLTETTTPPLLSSVTKPSTTASFSRAASISSQPLLMSRRRLDSLTRQSRSLTCMTMDSILSPTLTMSSTLTVGSSLSSVRAM